MSNLILVIGESGTGKSASIENLEPQETFIIQVVNKPLPFKGFKKNYPLLTKKNPGNRIVSSDHEWISEALKRCELNKQIKTIVIDDFQYVLSDEYMRKATEKGFDKFTIMAQNYYNILKLAQNMREDLNIIFLSHSEKCHGKRFLCIAGIWKAGGRRRRKCKMVLPDTGTVYPEKSGDHSNGKL